MNLELKPKKSISQEEFLALIAPESRKLLGLLLFLTGDRSSADDLFQDACLEMWKNYDKFTGDNFAAWARGVARIQVMRYWRKKKNEKYVPFTEALLDKFVDNWDTLTTEEALQKEKLDFLTECLKDLNPEQRELLDKKYKQGIPYKTLATDFASSVGSLKLKLMRLRNKLEDCVTLKCRRTQ
jgi:RNA polymerase sigma-70 factor (ECF subfamily)